MVTPIEFPQPKNLGRNDMDAAERQARVDLAAC